MSPELIPDSKSVGERNWLEVSAQKKRMKTCRDGTGTRRSVREIVLSVNA